MLHLLRALLAAAVLGGAACSVYDSELPYSNSTGGSGGGGGDSSVGPHDTCVPQTEICNGKDDDCDGVTDEAEATATYCQTKVLNAESVCASGVCLKLPGCNAGFCNFDGLPENGCECACSGCDSQDDAGPAGAAK